MISSRELLRLTSTPHIRNEAPDAAVRGRPLKGAEVLRDSELLEDAKYKVYTGIYVANNFSLDLEVPSFSSKGYIWMRWGKPFQDYLEKRGLAVSEVIGLENDINPETSLITPLRDVREFEDGTFGQGMLYTGDFYIDNLDLRRFPFNSVSLPVVLEVDDPVGDLTYKSLRLIPDLRDSGQLIFDVSYQRSSWSAFWTLIQPLVVVMASIVLITRVLTEFRVEIPIAVLLTLIFLQDGYRSELPNLPYLSFLDSVYAIAYLLSIVSFALVLYLESLKRRASLEQSERRVLILGRIHFYEQSWPPVSLLVMVLLSAASWLLI